MAENCFQAKHLFMIKKLKIELDYDRIEDSFAQEFIESVFEQIANKKFLTVKQAKILEDLFDRY